MLVIEVAHLVATNEVDSTAGRPSVWTRVAKRPGLVNETIR